MPIVFAADAAISSVQFEIRVRCRQRTKRIECNSNVRCASLAPRMQNGGHNAQCSPTKRAPALHLLRRIPRGHRQHYSRQTTESLVAWPRTQIERTIEGRSSMAPHATHFTKSNTLASPSVASFNTRGFASNAIFFQSVCKNFICAIFLHDYADGL